MTLPSIDRNNAAFNTQQIQDNKVPAHAKGDGAKITLIALAAISATAFVSLLILSSFMITPILIGALVITGIAALALGVPTCAVYCPGVGLGVLFGLALATPRPVVVVGGGCRRGRAAVWC